MSHGQNANFKYCSEWKGKRPLSNTDISPKGMKVWKKLLHKIERVEGKKEIDEFLKESE